jgi:rubrerythrin
VILKENKRKETQVKEQNQELIDIAREAIRLELSGRAFFDHALEKTHNELGKKMFRKLAQDEIRHLDTFRQLFGSLIGDEDWINLVQVEKEGSSPVIDQLKARMKKEQKAGELEAISIGMELEKRAVDFFTVCSNKTSHPQAREIFEKICREEQFHYDLLQSQYDSVSNSGFWMDISEFRMDGKY